MNEDDLWELSDDELEGAYKEALAETSSPDTDIEQEFADAETSTVDDETDSEEEEDLDLDGPDQPEDDEQLEESGHDASDETDAEDVTEDDPKETEEDDPDGDSDAVEEEGSDEADDAEEETQPPRSYSFRANGKDYEFSSEEIVEQFPKIFGKAMDYTKKMQAIKPWRKTIDALEGAKLSHTDINLMIDVMKGDKGAITEVLKRTGTDTLELDTEADSNYVAKDYGRDESALAFSEVIEGISQDPEYATTHKILSSEWDNSSWETMSENPEMIGLLHADVKSGMFKTLQPIAEKLKVYGNGKQSDLEYYKEAAQQYFAKTSQQEAHAARVATKQQAAAESQQERDEKDARLAKAKAQSSKRAATKSASAKRKAAAPTKSVAADRNVVDYLDDSDEEFEEWYKKLQDSI